MRDDMREIRVAHIKVRENVRQGGLDVDDLAGDIKAHGLLQPLLVRRCGEGYELIAGHRRLAACKAIGMEAVPCNITDGHDTSRVLLQLAENVQRRDLSPYDIALALRSLRDICDGIRDTAARVGKSQPWVTKHLDYAVLYEGLRRKDVPATILDRVPMETLLELKAVPSDERAAVLREVVSSDAAQKVPAKAQFRKIIEAKRAAPREKRKADKCSFEIHRHGLVVALEFKTKLDVRRITQVLLERGGRVTL